MKTKKYVFASVRFVGALMFVVLISLPMAFAGQTLLTFDDTSTGDLATADSYDDLGIAFISNGYVNLEDGVAIKNLPSSPKYVLLYPSSPITCNVTNGFTAVSLYYVNGHTSAGQLRVYSGLNGSGTLLTSVSLPQTPITGGTTLQTWVLKSLSHSAAQSFQISGVAQYVGVDDIRITGEFLPRIILPYQNPTAVSAGTAILHAAVNPEGATTSVYFEYATNPSFTGASITATQSIGSGTSDIAVTQEITGLARGTIYYYRVVASNVTGTSTGEFATFATLQTIVQTLSASSVNANSALLKGAATPQELSTDVYFLFSTNSSLFGASRTSTQNIGSGTNNSIFSVALSDLSPGVYYYQAVASNAAGAFFGERSAVAINSGYIVSDSTTGTFTNITSAGTQVIGSGVDYGGSSTISIGFAFPFFGNNKTNLFLSANGLLTFEGVNPEDANLNLAITIPPHMDTIAVLWDDWVTDAGVYVKTIGPVGQRVFVAQWNCHPYGGTEPVTFQVQLFEATADILMIYSDATTDAGHNNGEGATIGIRKNGAPANGLFLIWSYNSGDITSGTQLRFSPQRPIVANLSADSFATDAATLHAEVNPNNNTTTAFFEYGPTTSYGSTSVISVVSGTNAIPQLVSGLATGLAAPATYHYRVVASNSLGTVTSPDATFYFGIPNILQQPHGQIVSSGSNVSFSVTSVGVPPLSCRWVLNGGDVTDATNSVLTLTNIQLSAAGDYQVIITNNYGGVTSSVAVLTVVELPSVASHPASRTNIIGDTVTFSVTASGTGPLNYRWRKSGIELNNGGNISGSTSTTLSMANVQTNDAGSFDVVVTNAYGRVTSLVATLTIVPPPTDPGGTAVRELPFDFHPGDLVQVRIQVTPPVGVTNWFVHEQYPNGWDLISVTNASSTNEFISELTFGPFTNDTTATLFYTVASIQGLTNSAHFTGEITFNDFTKPIVGTTNLPARNEWLFVGPQSLEQGTVSGVAYGAGRWLASSFGWVTTLETGGRLTYPRVSRFYGDGWSRLAYVGGLFLHFGSGNSGAQMMISDDGLLWKQAQKESGDPHADPFAETGSYIQSVAYGNGTYVAVGEHYYSAEETQWAGAIFTSTNGYNWRRVFRLLNPSRHINAVTFAENRFMAVADRGTVLTSTNGLVWSESQPITGDSTNRNLLGICYGPAGWIITASSATSVGLPKAVLRSPDGEAWNEFAGIGPGNSVFWQSFYADGKYWFGTFTDAYTTSDGTSWSRIPSISPGHPVGPVDRAPDGVTPQYLGAGALSASLVSSTNGTAWTFSSPSVNAVWPRYLCAATFNNEWIVSSQGEFPTGGQPGPSDRAGNTWIPNFYPYGLALNIRNNNSQWRQGNTGKSYADMLATANGVLVAGVDGNQQLFAGFLVGTDYAFASATPLPHLVRFVNQVSYKGLVGAYVPYQYVNSSLAKTPAGFDLYAESYVAGGFGPSRLHWGHFISTNGSNWERRSQGLNDVTNFPAIRGLAWGNNRFVAVSEGRSPGTLPSTDSITTANRIYTSTDGESYLPVDLALLSPSLGVEGLTGVAYGDGKFVAIGNLGRILHSINGLDWVTVRNSDGHRWNRVRYLAGAWAAVGNAGLVAFSDDGENWTSKTSGTEADLTDISHQNGQYMVVGSHAMVLLSLPINPPIILTESVIKLPSLGLQFNVSGQVGKIFNIQTSSNLVEWTSLSVATNSTGTVTIIDSQPSQEQRFYRVLQQ